MRAYISQLQKIVATCLLRADGRLLLLRRSEVADRTRVSQTPAYFDVPRFEVRFGEDPEAVVRDAFYDYFEERIEDLATIDVEQYVTDDGTTQVFEIIYTLEAPGAASERERHGAFFYADIGELDRYMFPSQYAQIERYL